MKLFIADAFTTRMFGGNPAGIVLLENGKDYPDDSVCVNTAKELRYSETAFIRRLGEKEFELRYFTPAREIELCGHATIGSFYTMFEKGLIGTGNYTAHTRAGDLDIEVGSDGVLMDMAPPALIRKIGDENDLSELYGIMGLDLNRQREAGLELIPAVVSTGLADIMMPVADLRSLNDIEPDLKALTELSKRYGIVSVHAFTNKCSDAMAHARDFAPVYMIDEESATGTANGALTYYAYLNGFAKPGSVNLIIQGEKMQRYSEIITSINETEKGLLVKVGGKAVIVAEGDIRID